MKFFLSLSLSFFSLSISAQITTNSQWVWMKGDSVLNKYGVYGTKGIPDVANKPGGRSSSSSWTDSNNNLWLFGGYGNAASTRYGDGLNDLWKYDPSTDEWVWLNGDSIVSANGLYGTKGVSSPNNKPGSRWGAFSWADNIGNLWLFGGYGRIANGGYGFLSDLWEYNIASNEWTWISGNSSANQVGVYGTKGIASSTNKPGGRRYGVSWIDNGGNFWLFGGQSASGGSFNDLWTYAPSTNNWTWMSGDTVVNKYGVYGTLGLPSTTNKPGSRSQSSAWIDSSNNLWLFGGYGNLTRSSGLLNDLWKYDLTIYQWTWVSGDCLSVTKKYGILGIPSITNKPGGRAGMASWSVNGKLYFLGGYDYNPSGLSAVKNDLWEYNTSTTQWTWLKGDSTFAPNNIYGTLGVASPFNKPGGRELITSWKDTSGNIWLFGGTFDISLSVINDLWKLDKDGFVWIGITSSNWTQGSNWSGGVAPGANDDALVPGGTPYSAIIPNATTVSVRSLRIMTGGTVVLGTNSYLNITH